MSDKPLLVAAVSGGVDSMVMLDKLSNAGQFVLVVAHVNHGIRSDSDQDEALVRAVARHYGWPFRSIQLELGSRASEDQARQRRWQFLESIQASSGASAIATAHHLDDVVETIILNTWRGTGWRGLCSLRETESRRRPLLDLRKSQILAYAIDHGLEWREDSTNDDLGYTRNLIRQFYVPRLNAEQFETVVKLWRRQCQLRPDIDTIVESLRGGNFNRQLLELEDGLAAELLRGWLGRNYQAATFARLIQFGRSASPGKLFNLPGDEMILAERTELVAMGPRKLLK